MISLLQRVDEASVQVNGKNIAKIDSGLMVLVGIERNDTEIEARRMSERLLNYRIFNDENERMNLNVQQINGSILLIPQFTLSADTSQGNRPSFSNAADPKIAGVLFDCVVATTRKSLQSVVSGKFGADMLVKLVNNGPVTFVLEVPSRSIISH